METKLIFAILATLVVANPVGAIAQSRCLATYALGDSNTDTGGSVAAGIFELRYPYGITFPGHPDGRSSDGLLIIDFLVEALGFEHLSPYLESVGSNFTHGANFAIGGATILKQEGEGWLRPFDLLRQVNQLAHFKSRLIETQGQGKQLAPDPFQSSLFVIDIGINDLAANLFASDAASDALITNMVGNFSDAVHRLSEKGAIHIWVHNTGPLGCLPSTVNTFKTINGSKFDEHGCAIGPNALTSKFNNQLKSTVAHLRTQLPHLKITYVDIYAAKYSLFADATKLGFVNPMRICSPLYSPAESRIAKVPCTNPETQITLDSSHFTHAANRWVAEQILRGSISDPPTPFLNACGAGELVFNLWKNLTQLSRVKLS